LSLDPATVAVRQIDAQVFQGYRSDFQPPLKWCIAFPLQADADPPGMQTLSDTGLAFGWHEARLYVRALQVVDVQLGSGIGQQRDVGIQSAATVTGTQEGGFGMRGGLAAKAQEQGEKDDAHQTLPGSKQWLSRASIAGGSNTSRARREGR